MLQQHGGELLKGLQSLPPKLVDPALQVIQHRAFVAVRPEPIQALFEKIRFQQLSVEGEQPV